MSKCDDCFIYNNDEFSGMECCSSNCDDVKKWFAEHDKQVRDEVIIETLESVIKMIADWGYEDLTSVVLRENLKVRIEQMKGE